MNSHQVRLFSNMESEIKNIKFVRLNIPILSDWADLLDNMDKAILVQRGQIARSEEITLMIEEAHNKPESP